MGGEDLVHETDTPCHWQVGQANQTGVLAALQEDEAAEMLVQGNQDPFFRCGLGEQGSIARIRPELPRPQDIVPLFFQQSATRRPAQWSTRNRTPATPSRLRWNRSQ